MKGDDRVRHCGACRQNVYNFDRMKADDVVALVDSQQRVCGRFFRRSDGTIITSDCSWVWASAKRRAKKTAVASWFPQATAVGAALLVLVALAFFAITLFGDNVRKLMGASAGGVVFPPHGTSAPPPSSKPPMHEAGRGLRSY